MAQTLNYRFDQVKKHFGYTNEELGKVCGVSYAAIAKIINGDTKDPSVSLCIHISKKLNVSIKWLLFGEGDMLEDSGKTHKIDNSDYTSSLKNKVGSLQLIIDSKDSEIKTLKKIINLLEEKIEQKLVKKKAS